MHQQQSKLSFLCVGNTVWNITITFCHNRYYLHICHYSLSVTTITIITNNSQMLRLNSCEGNFFKKFYDQLTDRPTDQQTNQPTTRLLKLRMGAKNMLKPWKKISNWRDKTLKEFLLNHMMGFQELRQFCKKRIFYFCNLITKKTFI